MHRGTRLPRPPLREPFRGSCLSRSVSRMLNLGSKRIRFSILIIANSTAIDVYVGSRDPGDSTCEARQPGFFLLLHGSSLPASTQHMYCTVVPLKSMGPQPLLGWHGASNAAPTSQISGA